MYVSTNELFLWNKASIIAPQIKIAIVCDLIKFEEINWMNATNNGRYLNLYENFKSSVFSFLAIDQFRIWSTYKEWSNLAFEDIPGNEKIDGR